MQRTFSSTLKSRGNTAPAYAWRERSVTVYKKWGELDRAVPNLARNRSTLLKADAGKRHPEFKIGYYSVK